MTAKLKPRARRKPAVSNDRHGGFYTPIDGWAWIPIGYMNTNEDIRNREFIERQREDPFGYWAAVRDEMI